MTDYKDYNYPLFIRATARCRSMGMRVVSPTEINPPPSKKDAEKEWWPLVRKDLNYIWNHRNDCEGIITLPRHKDSVGGCMEWEMIIHKLKRKHRRYADIEASKSKRRKSQGAKRD